MFLFTLKPEYQDLRKEIVAKLENYPVLRSRILMFEDMKTTKNLKEFVDRICSKSYMAFISMYRTRNAIVHSGDVPRNLKYLQEHLHSYVDATVKEFIVKLSGSIPFESVEDVIVDIRFAIDNLDNAIGQELQILTKNHKYFNSSRIGSVMHCEQHLEEMDENE